LIWWFYGLCFLSLLCFLSFLCSNKEEPVLGHKELYIDRVKQTCPHLPWHTPKKDFFSVIKPAHSTSVGMGVDFETSEWTREKCESFFSIPCMIQPYHPGPWEVRLYKSIVWEPSVAWKVPCIKPQCEEPIPHLISFSWQKDLQACIDKAFPHTDFMAVDVRSTGNDLLVLEINGTFGMPYAWATNPLSKTDVIVQHFKWIKDRIQHGIYSLSIERIFNLICLGGERHLMNKKQGNIWF